MRLLIAFIAFLVPSGVFAQCSIDLVAVGTGNWSIYRDTATTPLNLGNIRDIQVAIRTALQMSMLDSTRVPYYPTGVMRYRAQLDCIDGFAQDTLYLPGDTVFVPVTITQVDTIIVVDTVFVPVNPDTTSTQGRMEVLVSEELWGYAIEVFLYDSIGAPVPQKEVVFTIGHGYFGPDNAHICDGPCSITRLTGSAGRTEVGWRISQSDTLIISSVGLSPYYLDSNKDEVLLIGDSIRTFPRSSPTNMIEVNPITNSVQLWSVVYSGGRGYTCGNLNNGHGWYEVDTSSGIPKAVQGGLFLGDQSCVSQPLSY